MPKLVPGGRRGPGAPGAAVQRGWPCPACGADASTLTAHFGAESWLPGIVVRCEGCSLRYKIAIGGPEAVDALYQRADFATHEYWSHEHTALGAFAWILDEIADARGGRRGALLDIGCGPGTFPALAVDAGYDVTAVEPNPVLAEQARSSSGITVLTGRFDQVALGDRRFDVITVLDVIEHLVDPIDLLERCRDLLAPGGILVVYTPNHDGVITRVAVQMHRWAPERLAGPVREIFDGPHVVFFDGPTLRLAFARAGLVIERCPTRLYAPERSGQAPGLVGTAVRGLDGLGPLCGGRFRLLALGRRAGDERGGRP